VPRTVRQTLPKYVMFYDKLKKDLKGEMRRLMKFLDAKYNEMDFNCMLKNYEGHAHRTSTQKVNSLQYFSSEGLNISTI
jgi:hypothetical protein